MNYNEELIKDKMLFFLQLETIKSGSPIAKSASKSEENLIEANLYKEGNCEVNFNYYQ